MARLKLDDLKKSVDTAYTNPMLHELKRLEEDKKNIFEGLTGSFPATDTINDLQNLLKHSGLSDAFKTIDDYKKYSDPLLDSIVNKDYVSLQKELKNAYTPYLKTSVSQAMDAIGYAEKSIEELTGNTYLDVNKYSPSISSSLSEMAKAQDLLKPTKSLTASMKQIETDMFQDKMAMLNERRIELPRMMEAIEIPENPMIKQNEEIITSLDVQNETLVLIGQYISSQNEKLDTQNKIVEEEIKVNKESAKNALWTAIASIFIAIVATVWAIWVSYDVYNKENKSNNKQHQEVMKLLGNLNDKGNGDIVKSSDKQVEVLNAILKAMQKNNSISKVKEVE